MNYNIFGSLYLSTIVKIPGIYSMQLANILVFLNQRNLIPITGTSLRKVHFKTQTGFTLILLGTIIHSMPYIQTNAKDFKMF